MQTRKQCDKITHNYLLLKQVLLLRFKLRTKIMSTQIVSPRLLLPAPSTVRLLPPSAVEPVTDRESAPIKRVLLVDDNESHIDTLEMFFSPDKYEVFKATSGRRALEIYRPGSIAAVVTDLQMPGMNGDRLAAYIKGLDRSTRIILITGNANAIDSSLSRNLDGVVMRPYDGRHLVEVLELALQAG